ncbi:hypothetical protein Peur_057839 [Populus x canadensis]
MKSTARRQQTVAASSFSSEEDVSLGAQWKDDLSMFTNIEAARTITLAFKSSMEIPLFQWSQVSRHPKWKPNIDAWFRRF